MEVIAIDALEKAELEDKKVLLRVDFNVPLKNGKIQNDQRMRAALPTIQKLLDQGACVVLMSHLGRPKGEVVEKLRLGQLKEHLSELLETRVVSLDEIPDSRQAIEAPDARVVLLENTRFYPGEEKNDPDFAKALAALGDLYVNDAFGTAHRAHASTAGVADYLPAYAGLLMKKEIEALSHVLEAPQSPFIAVIGGAKVSSKLGVLENLLEKVDKLVIGGAMAYTFLAAQGKDVAQSLVEPELYETARNLMKQAREVNTEIVLPVDMVMASSVDADEIAALYTPDENAEEVKELTGVDIGPQSIALLQEALSGAKTVLWNGPMGVFENPPFATGTQAIARTLAEASDAGATTIVGGGDSVAAVEGLGLAEKFSHVSTGGGASLEFLEGRELPGIAVLKKR